MIVQIPDSLPYPRILPIDKVPELKDRYCYIIEKYERVGVALVVVRSAGAVCIRGSDFDGKVLEPSGLEKVSQHVNKCVLTMQVIKVPMAMFYFSFVPEVRLVDVRLSINKFCSPGWLHDFFGVQGVPIQVQVGKSMVMSEENLDKVKNGLGDYARKSFIIKSSAFKVITRGDEILPLYGEVS